MNVRRFKIQLLRYEYWPWWLFFIPMFPIYLWNAIRLRSFVYFTLANPGIEYGGFFGERKNDILKHLPTNFLARSEYLDVHRKMEVLDWVKTGTWTFPLVIKPDVGERGDEVTILRSESELVDHLNRVDYPMVVQEYIEGGIELGVLYCRYPNDSSGRVTSITKKNFLSVEGDGKQSVAELLEKTDRGYLQLDRLREQKKEVLEYIPMMGELVVVEAVGNHCLGTEFVNWNHLITPELSKVFDQISLPFEGFYYGRYDLKIESVDAMNRGEGIRVFELNGVTSEPGHIYDKEFTLQQAYRDVWKHQTYVYEVCRQNRLNGKKPAPLNEIIGRAYSHFFKAKR
ncbi:MAG: hypothetical protein H6608_02030 [Flavobacteriales bacterium]|nr:hypothetical protein [Bacteroidota bacterium]MCB9239886.1 hypothetical protein [Flavobacteriales bacterium]